MLQDLRLALRALGRQPAFTALALLIVALGAGANASVFSVVKAVLLEPLPYARPDRLLAVWPSRFVSNADVDFLRTRSRSFTHVGASSPGWTLTLVGAGEPVRVIASKTSANLFALLGVAPLLGRTFEPGEDAPGRHRVVVLSHALWRARFAGEAAAIGRIVTIEDAPHEVIGVMGPEFELLGREADLFLPLPFDPASSFYRGSVAQALARLRDGLDVADARREIRALVPEWQRALGYEGDWGRWLEAAPLREYVVGDVRQPLLVLTGAVALVVMLTAANLGTLLLGRHVARRREVAVRGALGASAWRLLREAAVESVVLATLGAAAGTAAAWLALPALVGMLPPEMPRAAAIGIDPLVAAAVISTSIASVVGFGTLPSLASIRPGLQPLLRPGTQSETPGGRRALDALVVGQVALAIVLGIAAALMARTFVALQRVDPGFEAAGVLTMKLLPSGEKYRGAARSVPYFREVMARVSALPGVEAVGAIHHLPLSGYNWSMRIRIDEQPLPPGVSPPTAGWRMIDGRYFESMRIPLVAGRTFDEHDAAGAEPVAIVSETFARRFFGGAAAAVGRTLRTEAAGGEQTPRIVGIVGSVRHDALAEEPEPELYRPAAQGFAMPLAITMRTTVPPSGLTAAVRETVRSIDADVPIAELLPLTTLLRESLGRPRLLATLLVVFASAGLAIVACGVYGVVAYGVRRRERELGIRLALGAAPASVGALVLRQGAGYAAAGLALGVPAALAATGAMRGLLFGVEPRDPRTVAALAMLIAATTVAATLTPALRARRLDPAAVLRSE